MNTITIDFNHSKGTINPNLYGHFAEHIGGVFYDGLWVGPDSEVENINGFRKALVDSFKKINPPIVRWPGGCFAETYDWRDGIGPREKRPRTLNWWYSCDHRAEPNQVGTHEFIDFCRLVGAEPYIAANMTTTTPLQIRNWVEYCNMPAGLTTLTDERAANGSPEPFNVRYWGIGNENWGGGGYMTPEHCADEFIRYTSVIGLSIDRSLKFIMCGADAHHIDWTRRLLQQWKTRPVSVYGMSVHYYTGLHDQNWTQNFTEEEWYTTMFRAAFMRNILDDHRAAMDEFDPERKIKIILDEWGCWHKDGSGPSNGYNLFEQQSSMMDAVVAALTLNIFNDRCDFVDMANIAQLCNNLHSLFLAAGDKFVETPNYHVFDMYQGHKGAKQLNTIVNCPMMEREKFSPTGTLSASSSIKDGVLTLTIANLDLKEQTVALGAIGGKLQGKGTIRVLSHEDPHTCNTFDAPHAVVPVENDFTLAEDTVITVPGAGIVALTVKLEA